MPENVIKLPVSVGATVYTIGIKNFNDWYSEYCIDIWTVMGYQINSNGLSPPGVWTACGFYPVTEYAVSVKYYTDIKEAEEALEQLKREDAK